MYIPPVWDLFVHQTTIIYFEQSVHNDVTCKIRVHRYIYIVNRAFSLLLICEINDNLVPKCRFSSLCGVYSFFRKSDIFSLGEFSPSPRAQLVERLLERWLAKGQSLMNNTWELKRWRCKFSLGIQWYELMQRMDDPYLYDGEWFAFSKSSKWGWARWKRGGNLSCSACCHMTEKLFTRHSQVYIKLGCVCVWGGRNRPNR